MKPSITLLLLALISACSGYDGGKNENPYEPVTPAETATFANPVIEGDWPDPTIWKVAKTYYTVATCVGDIYKSTDMYTWTSMGRGPLSSDAAAKASAVGSNFWAPDVAKIGKTWMLYLTCYNSASDCGICAFSSSTPTGPFDYVGVVTHSKDTGIKDTIDPEVVVDDETGKVWLFFGSVGGVHRVQLTSDGKSLAEGATYDHVAGVTIGEDSSRQKVFEGSYLLHKDGYWYLFVSCGNYWDASYKLKVGRSKSLDGEFVDKDGKPMVEGNATVVLSSSDGDRFYGPGHNGDVFTDSDGQYYMFYHCHDNTGGDGRPMLLQRMFWGDDGWPYFDTGKPLEKDVCPNL